MSYLLAFARKHSLGFFSLSRGKKLPSAHLETELVPPCLFSLLDFEFCFLVTFGWASDYAATALQSKRPQIFHFLQGQNYDLHAFPHLVGLHTTTLFKGF